MTSAVEPIATMGKRGILALSLVKGVLGKGTGTAMVLDTNLCVITRMNDIILQRGVLQDCDDHAFACVLTM